MATRDSYDWKCLIAGKKAGHMSVWTILEFTLHWDPKWDKRSNWAEVGISVFLLCVSLNWYLFLGKELLLFFWEEPFKSKWEATFIKFFPIPDSPEHGSLWCKRPADTCLFLFGAGAVSTMVTVEKEAGQGWLRSWISGLVLLRTRWVLAPEDRTSL